MNEHFNIEETVVTTDILHTNRGKRIVKKTQKMQHKCSLQVRLQQSIQLYTRRRIQYFLNQTQFYIPQTDKKNKIYSKRWGQLLVGGYRGGLVSCVLPFLLLVVGDGKGLATTLFSCD